MATVYVSMGQVGIRTNNGITSIWSGRNMRSETVTSSGTSAAGALDARRSEVAMVVCATAVYAMAATTPVATATNGIYCPAGVQTYIAMHEGDSIAVIDA